MFEYSKLSSTRKDFIHACIEVYPDLSDRISNDQIQKVMREKSFLLPQWLIVAENRISRGVYHFPRGNNVEKAVINIETDDQISTRIKETYESMNELVKAVASNTVNSLVVAGGAGLGKSYTVNKVLKEVNHGEYGYVFHRGYLRASHLFRLLWENRHPGMVVVLDDCDIWHDETALNILKAALELKPSRRLGWGSEKEFIDEDGEVIPRYFDFEGSVIFLTNLSVRDIIESGSKQAPHLAAIESRSLVLDLKIRSKKEYMIKIRHTLEEGMLKDMGITKPQEIEILKFMEDNLDRLVEVSLRMVEKIALLYKAMPNTWRKRCERVCLK